jgi:uncharacterized protein (TIGR01777 family)
MMSVAIAGANGFIGRNLAGRLHNEGYMVSFISRKDVQEGNIGAKIRNCQIVVNLIGESIAGIWSRKKKKKIYESRVLTTRKLVGAVNKNKEHVKLLIQVSGVGVYDNQHSHTEDSKFYDQGFLARVIIDWEGELAGIAHGSLRVVILRLGIVLDKNGGILKTLLFPLRYGIGFGIKSDEFLPFIQLEDLMDIFVFCIRNLKIEGVINVVSPSLTKINRFYKVLARVKNRRILLWFNSRFLKLAMGESADLLTRGQRVLPEKLEKEGFNFRYGNIEDALNKACN